MYSVRDWHNRFLHQGAWTTEIRKYLLEKASLSPDWRVLDVGFGTGAVRNEFHQAESHGVDLNWDYLLFAGDQAETTSRLVNGDAYALPYRSGAFDLVTCHFFLLWIANPPDVIEEMVRVCKPGGRIIFFAEPDYGGRIDFPPALEEAGKAQIDSLINQGADPYTGRKLLEFAVNAGLTDLEVGILNYLNTGSQTLQDYWEDEWRMLVEDLRDIYSPEQLAFWHKQDLNARDSGTRIQFVPTFYLFAAVPDSSG